MPNPSPRAVVNVRAKIDTSTKPVTIVRTTNVPRIATTATTRGSRAATNPPKTTRSASSVMGDLGSCQVFLSCVSGSQ
jgi:hypothetical protein